MTDILNDLIETWTLHNQINLYIAHESHHRGHIAQMFKQSGFRPPQELSYGTWGYWGGYELKEPELQAARLRGGVHAGSLLDLQ